MAAGSPPVEPEIRPVGGPPQRTAVTARIRPAQGGARVLQHHPGGILEPADMAELHRDADPAGEGPQRTAEGPLVSAEVRWQLEEDRSQLPSELARPAHQPMDRLLGVSKSPHVREVAAGLDRDDEVDRERPVPRGEGRGFRQPVEGVVQLHCRETGRVVGQPLPSRQPGGVEPTAPVPVVPP